MQTKKIMGSRVESDEAAPPRDVPRTAGHGDARARLASGCTSLSYLDSFVRVVSPALDEIQSYAGGIWTLEGQTQHSFPEQVEAGRPVRLQYARSVQDLGENEAPTAILLHYRF